MKRIPESTTRAIALAAALVLTWLPASTVSAAADVAEGGTVIAWGNNNYGQATVPDGLTDVVAIAAGTFNSLALKADGTVVAWGNNSYGQATIPDGLTDVVAIAMSAQHCLALKSDGTVIAWGRNDYGQATVPDGLTDVVAIAAGSGHSLALKSDGTVISWGWNGSGQATVPAGLTDVVAIAAGTYHSLALKSDGTVIAWGNNNYGQLNVPAELTNVVAVSARNSRCLALTSGGTVIGWGDPQYSQVPSLVKEVEAISAGYDHALAVSERTGSVVPWGLNQYGQIHVPDSLAPSALGDNNVVAIAAGSMYSLALVAPPPKGFAAAVDYPAGTLPNWQAVADLNGDGNLDLVVPNLLYDNGTVAVLLGNGDGTFQNMIAYPTDGGPQRVAIADLNGDGILDVAVTGYYNTVSVLLGNGDGTFQPYTVYETGETPRSIAIGDLNGDGILDLVAANAWDYTVSVLIGVGDGSFEPKTDITVGGGPEEMALADLNGDGNLDLAVAGDFGGVAVLLGNGDGTFQDKADYPLGGYPSGMAIADLDGDGNLDMVVPNGYESSTVSVLLGHGDGTFDVGGIYPAGLDPRSVSIADLDGDGKLDLAIPNSSYRGTVAVLFGNGDGTFSHKLHYHVGNTPCSVAIGDLNGDGRPDLATVPVGTTSVVAVLLNTTPFPNRPPVAAAGADQDLAVPHDGSPATATVSATLDGSASSDADGDELTYLWLEGADTLGTTATLAVNRAAGTHAISLTVTDTHGATGTDAVVVTVASEPNAAPVSNAGPDQTVGTTGNSAPVTLTGAGSSDPDGDALTYAWTENGSPIASGASPSIVLATGMHTITLTVTDPYGATATDAVVVTVRLAYSWSGVLQPIDPPNASGVSASVFKSGSTVPLKFALTGSSAGITTLAATLSYARISSGIVGTDIEATSTAAATTGNLFRYDAASGQYIFNWSTKGLDKGTYRLFINLGDGVARTVDLGLK